MGDKFKNKTMTSSDRYMLYRAHLTFPWFLDSIVQNLYFTYLFPAVIYLLYFTFALK